MIIARIGAFEFLPLWRCSNWFVGFKAWKVKTDVLCWCRRWMSARIQLNNARFSLKFQLPWTCSNFNSPDPAWILHNPASTDLHNAIRWWIDRESSKRNEEIGWTKLREFERIWDEDCFGSEIVIVVPFNSVRISTLYHLLINVTNHA